MATNINLPRKPSIGEYANMPMGGSTDYNSIGMNIKATSPNFPTMPSNNAIGSPINDAQMANPGPNPYPQNHFNQGMNNFGLQSRQFQDSLENMVRLKYTPSSNMNMAPSPYNYDSNSSESYQIAMARMQGKFRPQEMFKNMEQSNFTQQRNVSNNPWPVEYTTGRSNNRRLLPVKAPVAQGRVDPSLGHNLPPDQSFPRPSAAGSPQQPYQMPSQYMAGEMFKPSREQQFAARGGMGANFHPQDFYQQEQMRQIANQYQPTQLPRTASNYLTANQRSPSSPFAQSVLPKPSQDTLYTPQFSASPKSNGPHPMMNVLDERQVSFANANYPGLAPQIVSEKPGFPPTLGMRGTVSPNVTIGMPKKPYRPQEEAVTSPIANQNAAAAAAAAAVLAAVNTAIPQSSPQSASDIHNITSRPPSVPIIPSRPPSIHAKEVRSPAMSNISDHKSESGGSGINDFRATPSPARPLSRLHETSVINFSSDVETGRVPSPSVNPSSDIEAMIQSVSNIQDGVVPSNEQSTISQRSKPDVKPEIPPKVNQRSAISPVTPPSPFSLSPSINVDFDIDMLSPSWEDPSSRSDTPLSKLLKISEEPERKEFLDRLVSCMEQHGKTFNEVPSFNGSILDLFKFYQLVSKRGGMQEVTRLNLWKEVAQTLTNGVVRNDDEQSLREHYVVFLLPYEDKLGGPIPQPPTMPGGSVPPTSTPNPAASPVQPDAGNIDLSTMTYKNLSMFQGNAPAAPYSQGGPAQATMQPPSYPNTPPTTQGFPTTPPMQHPGYRNIPQVPPGYHGYPQGSPRVPSYPSGHPGSGYSNQYPNFSGGPSQMQGYHNGMVPSRFPNYPGPRNTAPPDTMYMRGGQFPRGPGINKPFPHMNDPQSQMFANYQQQGQHPPGFMYQTSNMAAYQMERQRAAHSQQRGGVSSPRPRIQSPWGARYQDPGTSSGSQSPFHNSQSPKLPNVRPPPPYPHTKSEKPSPTPHSAAAALQYQAMKSGVKLTPTKKEDELFPAGCVEATQAVHTKKRRLTARDIGPVEAWRIMMSLKSGLLTETSWALDTLTILLSDDATVGFFRLGHLPGFLDTVVEHFRRNLINVFGVLRESEIDTGIPKRFAYGNRESQENPFGDVLPDLVATENFSSLIVGDCLTDDDDRGFCSGVKDWSDGGGDITTHIQTHLETDPWFYGDRGSVDLDEKEDTSEESDRVESAEVMGKSVRKGIHSKDVSRICKSSRNGGTNQENKTITNDREERKEHSNVQVEVNNIFNGLPSPEAKMPRKSVISTDSGVKTKTEVLDWGVQQSCCNGTEDVRDNCECAPTKVVEPSSKEEPSAVLIKRLKTELDLDVESVIEENEDITSSAQTCDMKGVTPTETECELKQEFPLSSLTLSQDSAINSCNCVSNIIRNLSFVPGNDVEMARHPSLLLILAKLLLLHHAKRRKDLASSESQYNDSNCWWQDCLDIVRENTLVTVANIAGYLDLSFLSGNVSRTLLEGLLHWLVCQSSIADEPLRSTSVSVCLTPKQLVLETLAKMSVLEANVDNILSSPDKARLSNIYEYLVKLFSDKTNEVTREFALVLLSSFTQAKEISCSERNLVTVLVGFLEDARDRVESMAVRGLHPGMFRDNDLRVSMGMLRRAGSLLACIAKRTQGTHLIPFQERILALSMSRALDTEVQSHLSNVLYNLPR